MKACFRLRRFRAGFAIRCYGFVASKPCDEFANRAFNGIMGMRRLMMMFTTNDALRWNYAFLLAVLMAFTSKMQLQHERRHYQQPCACIGQQMENDVCHAFHSHCSHDCRLMCFFMARLTMKHAQAQRTIVAPVASCDHFCAEIRSPATEEPSPTARAHQNISPAELARFRAVAAGTNGA